MSKKKGRFDQIETGKPGDKEKKPFFSKNLFKRKLEIDGIEREKLPPPPLSPTKVKTPTPADPIVTQSYPVVDEPPKAPSKTNVNETKVELDTLLRDIEAAERAKRQGQIQRRKVETQKQIQVSRETQLEIAKTKAESAKSTLVLWSIIIGVLVVIILFMARTQGLQGALSNIFYFVLIIVAGVFGRRRW